MTEKIPRNLLALIGATLLGVFLVQMDSTMVNIALESLRRDFDADLDVIQWVSTSYMLAMAAMIPVAGWAIDRFGSRGAWLGALGLFTIGSLLCGLAWSAPSLIAMRAVQGVGGGMLLPLFQTIIARQAAGRNFGKVMGLIGVPMLLGPVLGPILGGVLVTGSGWRWIFLVNLPICLVAAWAAARVLPADRPSEKARLDVAGLVLLSPALVAIIWGLSRISDDGGLGTPTLVALVVGAGLLGSFVVHALRAAAPIVDLRLFGNRDFTASAVLMFLAMVALVGNILLIPLYYQQVHGYTPLHAGLLLAPNGVGSALALILAGRVMARVGARAVAVTGSVLLLGVALAFTQLEAGTSQWLLMPLLLIGGVGFGAVLVPAQSGIYSGVDRVAVPHATTATRVFQQVGASLGVTVLAVSLQRNAAGGGSLGAAFGTTFWWTAGAAALLLIPALLLRGTRPAAEAEGAPPETSRAGRGS
ncbi:DHA2 family efflux MFS transporter permease subunit [Actinoplanes sp. HUAS TT8]|uniref:DHA2 family efflux MFS transporter permease subunit n=1 Tax=Actinoplanes sp. HUAS TT8 TaxID=3447453 RepID=UPI003F523D90